jgi:hypothetical protein
MEWDNLHFDFLQTWSEIPYISPAAEILVRLTKLSICSHVLVTEITGQSNVLNSHEQQEHGRVGKGPPQARIWDSHRQCESVKPGAVSYFVTDVTCEKYCQLSIELLILTDEHTL